jgi:hypothetical protein
MEEPFDQETARRYVLAILEGPGTTVFTRAVKEALLSNDMTSADAVNVLRGGHIMKGARTPSGWAYRDSPCCFVAAGRARRSAR